MVRCGMQRLLLRRCAPVRHAGGGPVTANTTDLGCHVQVDSVKENKVVLTVRYEDGIISEQ